jgi:hypothetical protein
MLEKRADSPASSARCVGGRFGTQDSKPEKETTAILTKLLHAYYLFSTDKNHTRPRHWICKEQLQPKN